jgi:hypothetical protein
VSQRFLAYSASLFSTPLLFVSLAELRAQKLALQIIAVKRGRGFHSAGRHHERYPPTLSTKQRTYAKGRAEKSINPSSASGDLLYESIHLICKVEQACESPDKFSPFDPELNFHFTDIHNTLWTSKPESPSGKCCSPSTVLTSQSTKETRLRLADPSVCATRSPPQQPTELIYCTAPMCNPRESANIHVEVCES